MIVENTSKPENNLIKPPRIGDIVEGKVIGIGRSAVYVDLGVFGSGIIFGREFYEARSVLKGLKNGDTIFAKITDLENDEGYVELSLSQAANELNWVNLRQKQEKGEIITVKISGVNKGGLITEVSGIPGFLPVSQLSSEHYPRVEGGDTTKIVKELQKFIGQELNVKILDLDSNENKLILSEKAKESEKVKETLKKYNVGDIVEGEITGIVDFGAFIKFGKEKLEGLIHISELDWQLIEDPSEVVKVGEKVKAKIIEIANDKVSLSLKALKKDPWQEISEKYKKEDIVEGQVTKFNPFGAFVRLNPQIQGLCHISEFGSKKKMEEKLEIGKKYKFQILEIKPEEHRMSLKLVE
jgi:small subunit ribosomal protein S1